MKVLLAMFFSCFFIAGSGQYYLNDMISLQQGAEQYKLLRANRIKTVKITGYDNAGNVSDEISLQQELTMDGKKMTITDATASGKKTTTVNSYENSRLKRAAASTSGIETKTDYTYDDKGRLQKLTVTTTDTAMKYSSVEVHDWAYDNDGQPLQMLRIKNGTDTMVVSFIKDEQNNIAEERWKKNNRLQETYFYYYSDKKQLTDIVRYNSRLKKMLPDFIYEYDKDGKLIQMTQVSLNSGSYFIWKYTYTEKGLRQKEACFDKARNPVGSVVYSYQGFQ